jgi:energy-coupling factor transport system substrate-specific component
MKSRKAFILTFSAIAVALNIVLGTMVQYVKIPLLFLDTIGTIFVAVLFGPWEAFAVGTVTNLLTPLLSGNVKDIPFFLVNAVVGLIVGFVARRYKFGLKTAIVTGVILSVVAPLMGTPIAVWVYGGLTGSGNDFVFAWLKATGHSIFTSAFIPRITGNLVDKIGSCLLVYFSMKYIPAQYKKPQAESISE